MCGEEAMKKKGLTGMGGFEEGVNQNGKCGWFGLEFCAIICRSFRVHTHCDYQHLSWA